MIKNELTINKDYVSFWTLQDALREFVQNAKDQEAKVPDNKMTLFYEKEIKTLYIANKNSCLSRNTLLFGTTTKSNDDKTIGQFGEGYKLAMLILTRLEKPLTIYNYKKREVWTCEFSYSRKYAATVLTVNISKAHIWKRIPDNNLTIKIENITLQEFEEFKERTLDLQNLQDTLQCVKGNILLEEKYHHKIFVNGLYVCDNKNIQYGYNIYPKYIQIGRDRNLLNSFDIQQVTSSMWMEHPNDEKFLTLLKNQAYDTKYCHWYDNNKTNNQIIGEKLFDYYKGRKRNVLEFVTSNEEADIIKKKYEGVTPIFVDNVQKNLIENTKQYKMQHRKLKDKERVLSSKQSYAVWKKKYKDRLPNQAIKDLDRIIRSYENKLSQYEED